MVSLTIFLFVAFLMLFLGGIIFVHDSKNEANRAFLAWVAFVSAWMIFSYLENVSSFDFSTRTIFLHADFAAAIIGAALILIFVLKLIKGNLSSRSSVLILIPAIIVGTLSLMPSLFEKVYLAVNGDIQFVEGPLFSVYAPALVVYLILANIFLLRHLFHVKKEKRAQILPVAIGLAISTVVAFVINLYFQNALSADVFRIGIYVWLLLIIGVSWSIGRHRFLHVRFVVIEIMLLGVLATMLTRTILSNTPGEIIINIVSMAVLLLLGFAMIRSFLSEEKQNLELQKLTKKLRSANRLLRKLDTLKTTMVSIASHQLRGPLGGMRGYLTMFKDGDLGPLTDQQKDIVKMNLSTLSRLLNAVETFLDITKIEAGKMVLRKEVLPLDQAVKDVAHEFEIMLKKKGLTLETDIEEHVWVNFDPEKIKHVIFNLIDNAMKYTEAGTISVSLHRENGEAVVMVTDTGRGVLEKDIAHIFGRFERGELAVDRGGSGLGLYIVKMLTEMQGGKVDVTSPGEGKGTTFHVCLPLSKDHH